MASVQKKLMVMVLSHLEYVTKSIAALDETLSKLTNPYETTITLVKNSSSIAIVSEIATDMSQFSSSKRLCY